MNSIGPRMTPLYNPEKHARLKDDYQISEPKLNKIEEEKSPNNQNEQAPPSGWPNVPFGD